MRISALLNLAIVSHSAIVRACGGHGHEVREWSQDELDELERKWGTEVSGSAGQLLALHGTACCRESPANLITNSGASPALAPLPT